VGGTFTDTPSQYDQLKDGVFAGDPHQGFTVKLDSFRATYSPQNGEPSDFTSHVTVLDHGHAVQSQDVQVNNFLSYDNVAFYQLDYGWAPHIVIKNPGGRTVFDGYVQMFSGPGGDKSRQSGVVKAPDFGYVIPGTSNKVQFGANVAMIPDAQQSAKVNSDGTIDTTHISYSAGGQEARNPVIQLQPYIGDLGLNGGQTQSVNSLNTAHMTELTPGQFPPVVMGTTTELFIPGSDGQLAPFTVSFPDLKQYSAFLIKKDNGVGLVYASFFLIMAGLLTKLYVRPLAESRRKKAGRVALTGSAVPGSRARADLKQDSLRR
jgi:cytochrome c biogenesis protein